MYPSHKAKPQRRKLRRRHSSHQSGTSIVCSFVSEQLYKFYPEAYIYLTVRETSDNESFAKVFDRYADAAHLSLIEDRPIVGLVIRRFVNRSGSAHIRLRSVDDEPNTARLASVLVAALQEYGAHTDAYGDIQHLEEPPHTIEVGNVPSLKALMQTLGERAVLYAVRDPATEVLIDDYPVQDISQSVTDTHRRHHADGDSLIG